MKVLIVSEPGVDGVFRHVEDLVDYLLKAGHQVSLAYSDVRGSDRLPLLIKRIHDAGGLTANLQVSNRPEFRDLRASFRLWRLHRAFTPDVTHAHSAKAGALVRLLRRFCVSTPAFYTPHAYYGMGRRSPLNAWFFNALERIFARHAMTFNVSLDEADFARTYLRVPASRQRMIPNSVDTVHFSPVGNQVKKLLREKHGIPPEAAVLGTLGRFSFQKDPLTLHRAFRACAEKNPNLWLIHVGRGDLRNVIRQYAVEGGYESRVIWVEYLQDPVEFYAMMDGFILTSRYEGFSLAALEALSMDLPLVLSEGPGNRDFGLLGLSHFWTARCESPESFSAAIIAWLEDRKTTRPSNHRSTALSRFPRKMQFGAIEMAYLQSIAGASQIHTVAEGIPALRL